MHDDKPAPDATPPRRGAAARHRPLNPRQRRFVDEYIVDLNGKQAAIRAGYTPGSASGAGSRLLRVPAVAAAIETALAGRAARTQVTADRVVLELAKVAFGDPRRLLALGPEGVKLRESAALTDAESALISEISETTVAGRTTRRVKLHCKMTALTALARHLGLFNGRLKPPEQGEHAAHEGESARERLARLLAAQAEREQTCGDPVATD